MSTLSTAVVGTFKDYGDSVWSTPDGRRPDDLRDGALLLTKVVIDADEQVKGKITDADSAVVKGGKLVCDEYLASPRLELAQGGRYIFFLGPQTYDGESTGRNWLVGAWPIAPDGIVSTPLDGDRTLDQLSQELVTGNVKPTPEVPEPPSASPDAP